MAYNGTMQIVLLLLIAVLCNPPEIHASGAFPIDIPSKPIIGINQRHTIKDRETLIDLAREYDVGYNEIVAANYTTDPWIPEKGEKILMPTKWLLPEVLDNGIVINLAEMRLYHFFTLNHKKYVRTYPLGIGRKGFNTPTGIFKMTSKVKDPVWAVPENIRKEDPELPPFVPPGPNNPLGGYWLQLSINGYGIHGTNRPYGIGRRVSHGCIRLYPKDIKQLFDVIKPGTVVKIVDEPVKIVSYDNKVYIEVHRNNKSDGELIHLAVRKLSGKNLLKHISTKLIIQAIKHSTGLPTMISQ